MNLKIEGLKGCTDGGCIFGHPGGMHTNGGCHCLSDIRPTEERLRIARNVHLLVKEIEHLRAYQQQMNGILIENSNLRGVRDQLLEDDGNTIERLRRLLRLVQPFMQHTDLGPAIAEALQPDQYPRASDADQT